METYELTLNESSRALARVLSLVNGRRWRLGALSYSPCDGSDRGRLVLSVEGPPTPGAVEAHLGKLYDVLAVRRLEVS
jgi:acetolactate synthase regulatory subunit